MIRRIIEINEEKCNGCGAWAPACHEGAVVVYVSTPVMKGRSVWFLERQN